MIRLFESAVTHPGRAFSALVLAAASACAVFAAVLYGMEAIEE